MSELGSKFKLVAQATVAKFAAELGKGKIFRVDSTYDTTSGVNTKVETEEELYMVFDEIEAGFGSSELGAEYLKENMLVLIAGLDVATPPEAGNLVQRPGSTQRHRIILTPTDMYGALYSCHVVRKAEG